MKQTPHGWQTDYRDRNGNRIREEYQSKLQAAAEQAIGQRRKETDRTLTKLIRHRHKRASLRCAQHRRTVGRPWGGRGLHYEKRCRRIATEAHNENGKPTCLRHQTSNHISPDALRRRAEAEALKLAY